MSGRSRCFELSVGIDAISMPVLVMTHARSSRKNLIVNGFERRLSNNGKLSRQQVVSDLLGRRHRCSTLDLINTNKKEN